MKVFVVNKVADWQPVSEYLLTTAFGSPLAERETNKYSSSEEEVFQRTEQLIKNGRAKEATNYSAVALYQKSDIVISLVLTVEPSDTATLTVVPSMIHLSMVRVIPNTEQPRLEKLDDQLAQEIAHSILHVHEEGHEGAIPQVRHFFRNVS